jgi:hypothetical protein
MENIVEKVHVLELKDSGLQRFDYVSCCESGVFHPRSFIYWKWCFFYRFSLGLSTRVVKLMSGQLVWRSCTWYLAEHLLVVILNSELSYTIHQCVSPVPNWRMLLKCCICMLKEHQGNSKAKRYWRTVGGSESTQLWIFIPIGMLTHQVLTFFE